MAVKRVAMVRIVAALLVPPVAWYLFQQGLAWTMRGSCGSAGPPIGPLWGVASLAACGLAAWIARPGDDEPSGPRFAERAAQLSAALFALAIVFQTLATMIVPACAR
jgi:hypothetical protein